MEFNFTQDNMEDTSVVYQIKDITRKNGYTRTDGRYPFRIGSRVQLCAPLAIGSCMFLEYLRDASGNLKNGLLRTGLVKEISRTNGCLIVETVNSIYTLREVKESDAN